KRRLVVAHYDAALATFGYGGERGRDIIVPGHVLFDIRSAEFEDQEHKYCALATGGQGQISALGVDEKGDVSWTRRLPGVPHLAIDYVTTGVLPTADSKKSWHWVLLAPDSSIHFVGADGEVLDKFNYGSEVRAVAVVEHEGKSILLASTPAGVEAWEIGLVDAADADDTGDN
ncbi:MAG: hypothetical protein MI757_10280, partial [Pirellulales bacterium]|nr:hypothetical protein [Pirellulales bacterium]